MVRKVALDRFSVPLWGELPEGARKPSEDELAEYKRQRDEELEDKYREPNERPGITE